MRKLFPFIALLLVQSCTLLPSYADTSGTPIALVYDSAGTGITSTNVSGKQGLDSNIINQITGFATSVNQSTQIGYAASSDASLSAINTKVATAANQATEISNLSAINTSTFNIAQATGFSNDAAASSDTGTFSLISLFKRLLQDNTTLISNNSTAALQTAGNSSLSTIATNTTGVATAANQVTGNGSLSTIATNTTNLSTNIGSSSDTAASSDTGTFSYIALFKRLLQGITTLNTVQTNGSQKTQDVSSTNVNKKIDANGSTYSVLTGPNGAASGLAATVTAFSQLRVFTDPSDQMHDKFNSPTTVDTTDRWTITTSGTAAAVTENSGLILTASSASGGYAVINSQPSFGQEANTTLNFAHEVFLESGTIATGYYRFWGLASMPATPTTTAPLTDAIGFEVGTTGTLSAVIWQGGTKVYSQALTAVTDGLLHRYSVQWRTDKAAFYVDSSDAPAAVASQITPNVTFLPLRMMIVTSASVSGTPVTKFRQAAVSDEGRNNVALSDGTFGFIKATIKKASTAPLSTDTQIVMGLNPLGNTVTTRTALSGAVPFSVSVGVASTQVVAANSSRKGLIMVNGSINKMTCAFGQTPTITTGWLLYPGGSFNMNEYNYNQQALNCIASAASSVAQGQEF